MTLPPHIVELVRAIVKPWVIVVAGGARCGSSCTMKQLEAAGIPLAGNASTSKLRETHNMALLQRDPPDTKWVFDAHGEAIKFLNPHVIEPPKGPSYRWIWLDRNLKQQTRSQIKCAKWMGRHRRPFNIRQWRRESLRVIKRLGGAVLFLSFDDMVRDPEKHATKIANFYKLPDETIPVMAAVVEDRSPACAPDMSIEGNWRMAYQLNGDEG